MTIYIDVIILENLIMNYIILYATGIIVKAKINYIRIFFASLIGAIYAATEYCSNITILADKGYVGEKLMQEMQEQTICLFALKRSNSKENWPKSVRQLIFKLRRRVETVFSQLSGQLNAERVLAKSFQGLCTRLVNKVLAYNLCIALNSIFGETCELGKIIELIF